MAKTVLITGGARGIGKAIASDFARDHAVAITYLSTQPQGLASSVMAVHADLTEPGMAQAVIETVIDRFGRLDVIVNNAGQVVPSPVGSHDAPALRTILDVNLLAPDALLAAALPHLQSGAAIVNISSVNAELPPMGAAIYGASKAALNLWTRGMAKELGPYGIRVNAVAPGAVNIPEEPRSDDLTALFVGETALGRLARPENIAQAVRFLASDAAGAITGEILTVSGGYRL